MNATPVSVILEHLSDGSPVERFTGTITKLYPMKHRGSGDSAFTKQDGEMKDEAGTVIPVEFRLDGDELNQSRRGVSVTIECVKTAHGLRGLSVMDDTYNNKTTRKLKVTKTANLAWADGNAGTAPAQTSQGSQASQSSQPSQGSQASTKPPPSHVDGQRAGMAINNAVKIIEGWDVPAGYFTTDQFGLDLWHVASRIIRVSAALEQGKLDPSTAKAKTQEQKAAEAAAAKKKAEEAEAARLAEIKRIEAVAAQKQQHGATLPGLDEEDEIPF